MTDSGAERAARRIHGLIFEKQGWKHADIKECHVCNEATAIIREETGTRERELFGRAMVIIKGLTLGTRWEIAPPIKREMEKLCADFEALPAAPDEGGTRG